MRESMMKKIIHRILLMTKRSDHSGREIDWERRRYEIAKECIAAIINAPISDHMDAHIDSIDREAAARQAVQFADALISVLKGK